MATYNVELRQRISGTFGDIIYPKANWNNLDNKPSTFTPTAHTHGNVSNDGKIGTTADLIIKTGTGGLLEALAAGSSGQFLGHDGTWKDLPAPDTATLVTGEAVTSMPVGTLDGTVDNMVIEGNLLDAPQLVVNGDFSDGTTGWGGGDSTIISASNGILSATGSGSVAYPFVNRITSFPIGDKLYSIAKAKVTNTEATKMVLATDSQIFSEQLTPIQNTWYYISGIITNNSGIRFRLHHYYVNSATALNKVMEVDYIYLFNISTLIANKQYSPLYNTTFDLMSDAQIKAQMDAWVQNGTLPNDIQAVSNTTLQSVGKNLWNQQMEIGSILTDTGQNTASTSAIRSIGYQRVKPSTVYVFTNINRWYLYDINYNFISTGTTKSFTTTTDTLYIRTITVSTDLSLAIQLEQGTVATTYEIYKENTLEFPDIELYRLPNGVKDTITYGSGEFTHTQRVKKYTLQASDVYSLAKTYTSFDVVFISKPSDFIYATTTYPSGFTYIDGRTEISYADSADRIGKIIVNESGLRWGYVVAKGTYADLAAAQADLAGAVIYYQLATPITTTITPTGELMAYENGTLYIDGTFTPRVSFDVPVNLSAQVQALITSADYQAKQIKALTEIIAGF